MSLHSKVGKEITHIKLCLIMKRAMPRNTVRRKGSVGGKRYFTWYGQGILHWKANYLSEQNVLKKWATAPDRGNSKYNGREVRTYLGKLLNFFRPQFSVKWVQYPLYNVRCKSSILHQVSDIQNALNKWKYYSYLGAYHASKTLGILSGIQKTLRKVLLSNPHNNIRHAGLPIL